MKSRLSWWRRLFIIKSTFLAATLSAASCWAAFSSAWQERGCIFDQVMSFCLPRRSLTSGTAHAGQRAALFAPSKETSTTDSAAKPQELEGILTLSEVAMRVSFISQRCWISISRRMQISCARCLLTFDWHNWSYMSMTTDHEVLVVLSRYFSKAFFLLICFWITQYLMQWPCIFFFSLF